MNKEKANQVNVLAEMKKIESNEIFTFVGLVTKKSLKKSRTTKEPTPMDKSYVKKLVVVSAVLGEQYEKAVNAERNKEGSLPFFTPNNDYSFYVSSNGLVKKHKDNDNFYLQIITNKCKSMKVVEFYYDTNGNEMTLEDFKKWYREYGEDYRSPEAIAKSKEKQAQHQGLQESLDVNRYHLEDIKGLKHGSITLDPDDDTIAKLNKAIKW